MNREKRIRELEKTKRITGYRLSGNKYKTRSQVFKDYIKFEILGKEIETQKMYLDHERG